MTIDQYLDNLNKRYKLGNATEHTFRGDLQQLIESLVPEIRATNEPKRQMCGAPDYILTKKDIPVGFIEAKDIGDKDLDGTKKTGNKEQFDRYKASLHNLMFTDYLNFHLYHDGEFVTKISLAEMHNGTIIPLAENFAAFSNLLKDFCSHIGQTIKSSKKLAEMMAGKARLLSEVIEKALTSDETNSEDSTLKDQMNAFKQILIHDITPKAFADVYAQTIAYGMFAARLHDPTLPTFSRQEAAELIPKSNPFLRKLFGYIAGPDIDDRIKWIVDGLVEIFLACNVEEILKNYGRSTKMEDPIIHFYETFLSEYDPKLRKARGVWYTPQPVVSFIVRAVDDILKTEFDLPQGLADTSKTTIKVNLQGNDKRYKDNIRTIDQEVHRVQILDPATGTGTFLAEAVKLIHRKFEGQQGIWSNYVENQLLPRLNGFELLMASYAMAHLKLDLLLTETGYKPTRDQRFRIYLTNSLEEHHPDTGTLFANWLSSEANEANYIKRDTPVMVVMGNPPYSVSSSNKSEWIEKLTADYKKDLNERNIQPLSDDYIKFIRFGQHFIDKNGSGILAYISNSSFIDGLIHRQMRKNLLESFDSIYILDLHGNSKKKETCTDGSTDQNVFDIMQGVSINLFVKTGKKKKNELGKVFHFDLFGKRDFKYEFLNENSLKSDIWNNTEPEHPNYFFVKKNYDTIKFYNQGFRLDEIWNKTNTGVETGKDIFFISDDKKELIKRFENITPETIIKFQIKDGSSFRFLTNLQKSSFSRSNIQRYLSKPFDFKFCYYDPKILRRASFEIQKELIQKKNIALICKRGRLLGNNDVYSHISICNTVTDKNFLADQSYIFPLYVYPETTAQQTIEPIVTRTPNLNMEIVRQIAGQLGLGFVAEKNQTPPNLPKGEALKSASNNGIAEGQVQASPSFGGVGEVPKPGYITANPKSYSLIKGMRDELKDNPTEAEKIIWEFLRNKKTGHKIRRQHVVDDFIPDFICLSKKVAIEIDGKIHLQQKEYDRLRTERLNFLGYEVVRFTNEEVFANPELVATKIKDILDKREDMIETPPNRPNREALRSSLNNGIVEEPVLVSPSVGGVGGGQTFAPIDLLDYIYAVLHSPTYRKKYKEFLKIDFPRVPYPKDAETFWQLVKLGGQIRQIHLLESPVVEKYITQYPVDGNNVVGKLKYDPTPTLPKRDGEVEEMPLNSPPLEGLGEVGRVYINETQYFDNVPEVVWNFYIGGYQPAQKWLKDRKDRNLEFEDIRHYQKIIVALTETNRIMKEIDGIEIE